MLNLQASNNIMKIYIEPPEIDITPLQQKLNDLPGDHELTSILQNVISLQDRYMEIIQQNLQYRIMWALRSLEKEIEEAGGTIILGADGQLTLKEFTHELANKIELCIKDNM